MRGADTFDGKISGNRQLVDRYNEAKGKKKSRPSERGASATASERKPKEVGGASGGAREESGHDEIKNVVGEHGQAVSHHVMKTQQGYHTMTHHEDGHVHHADHDSLADAHEHAATAHEDTEMPPEDYEVAQEKEGIEENPSRRTTNVGYMS